MIHYVGPRAMVSSPLGKHTCPRCTGKGSLRYQASGRLIAPTSYAKTGFWRTCSLCQGTGRLRVPFDLRAA